MSSLLARVERGFAWGLEVAQLAVGSIQVGLKPKGTHVKRVTRTRVGAVATIAALYTISSFCVNDFGGSPPKVSAVVHVYDRGERTASVIVTAGESEFNARLPAGSTVTMTVHMGAGKRLLYAWRVWRLMAGTGLWVPGDRDTRGWQLRSV
jgi:hypothetical protein